MIQERSKALGNPSTPDLVAAIRSISGESQEALARRLGVSFATVNAWERGRSEPRLVHRAQLVRLAEKLGMSVGLTVLAIDDDPAACAIVEGLVEASPFEAQVITTTNPTEGLILCGAFKPEVLLLDILMPGLDGFEVAALVRQISGLEVVEPIFISSTTDADILRRVAETGARLIEKPLTSDNLDEILAERRPLPVASGIT